MVEDTGSTDARIRFAIANRRLVEVQYGGMTRIAEPHDYGVQHGHERLLVFQRRGPSRPGYRSIGWRLFELSKIEELTVLDATFPGSRGRSHQDHYAWEIIYARVE